MIFVAEFDIIKKNFRIMDKRKKEKWIKPEIEDFSMEDTLGMSKESISFIESTVDGANYFGADSRGPS